MFWLQKGASFGKSQLLNDWTITDQNKKAYGGKIRISKASKLANIVKKIRLWGWFSSTAVL